MNFQVFVVKLNGRTFMGQAETVEEFIALIEQKENVKFPEKYSVNVLKSDKWFFETEKVTVIV